MSFCICVWRILFVCDGVYAVCAGSHMKLRKNVVIKEMKLLTKDYQIIGVFAIKNLE